MLRIISFAALIFVFAIFWTDALAEEAKVIYTDGSQEGKLDIVTIDEVTYISAISLGRQFDGLQLPYWNPLTKKMVLRMGDSRITLTAFSPLIIVDDNSFNLSLPSLLHQGSVYVPAKTFVHFLSKTVPGKLRWQDKFKTLMVETSVANISALRIEERTNGTIVFIYTEKDFKLEEIEDYTSKLKWLHLTVSGGNLDPDKIARTPKKGAVREIRALQNKGSAQISFRLDKDISNYDITTRDSPRQIVLSLRRAQEIEIDQETWSINTVIIDPGHGGKDAGSIGPTGLKEKDVTLDVAKRLRKLLKERLTVKTVMTRLSDVYVPLTERSRIATKDRGKVFISIHCNSNKSRRVEGSETYFLSEAETEDAKQVAQKENSVLAFDTGVPGIASVDPQDFVLRDIQYEVLLDMASGNFLKESQDLAALIQDEMSKIPNLKNRGVKQAGFYVMKGTLANMPSVMVETAFLSNPTEEKLLKRTSFRQKLARAIYEAVKKFKIKHESELSEG